MRFIRRSVRAGDAPLIANVAVRADEFAWPC